MQAAGTQQQAPRPQSNENWFAARRNIEIYMHEIIIAKELRYAHANNLFVSRLWEICIFIDFNTTLAFPARASVAAELCFRLQSQIQASINSIMVDNKAKQSPAFNCVSKKTFSEKRWKIAFWGLFTPSPSSRWSTICCSLFFGL